MSTLRQLGEEGLLALVERLFAADPPLPLGIGDDAALVGAPSGRVVVAADAQIEGVHFRRDLSPPDAIGARTVAVNQSDLAAMGAATDALLLTVSLPKDLTIDWVERLLAGVAEQAKRHGAVVAGGDLTGSPGPVALSVTALGHLTGAHPIRRTGAEPGHGLFVTGALGAAGLGLQALLRGEAGRCPDAVGRYRRPRPRCEEGEALGAWGACAAMIDLSDGLAVDAGRLAKASGVELAVDLAALPLHPEVARRPEAEALALALHGGEDFELLFCCAGDPPVPATRIGEVRAGSASVTWWMEGRRVERPPGEGFLHFG